MVGTLPGDNPNGWSHGEAVAVETAFPNPYLPTTTALAAAAAIGYMLSRIQSGRTELTVMNAMILAIIVAILGATAIPVIEMTSRQAKTSALLQNLATLRSQIELYKLDHYNCPPVLYEGGLPQLIRATNAVGNVGVAGSEYPYGPYLRTGIPVNPITDRSIITPTDTFPPTAPSGNGGWLYHQRTGQITADSKQFLGE